MQTINNGCESVYNNKKSRAAAANSAFCCSCGKSLGKCFCENGLFNSLFHKTRNVNSTDG